MPAAYVEKFAGKKLEECRICQQAGNAVRCEKSCILKASDNAVHKPWKEGDDEGILLVCSSEKGRAYLAELLRQMAVPQIHMAKAAARRGAF